MINSTRLKAHSTAAEPAQKGAVPRRIGRTKGGLNSKLHVVCDGAGKLLVMLLSEGQMSDHKGARFMLDALPPASALIADRGYDSNWFWQALTARGVEPCIPPTRSRETASSIATRRSIEGDVTAELFSSHANWGILSTRLRSRAARHRVLRTFMAPSALIKL